MKKLIALIGAVATAFGLYAAGPADYYANSFETTTEGASSDGLTWSPTAQWSTTLTDEFKLGDYTGSEPAGVYGQGAQRRDGSDGQNCKFENTTTNAKFLKLETGTNTLDCATDGLDMSQGKFYFDQLVKFTGFEEAPTFAADTKIAVWMSAIEQEGTPQIGTPQIGTPQIGTPAQGVEGEEGYVPASEDYQPASPDYQPASEDYQPASDDYIAGETNLYVQVGTGTESVSVQIDPASVGETEFAVDKWYRITIKSIGDVVAESGHDVTSQLGFLVFINGKQAAIVDAPDYHSDKAIFGAGAAAKYYAAGQLFTAIDTTSEKRATLAKVGYQGIGAIDDVVLSASSPDFDMLVDVEIASLALNGAKVIKIGDVTITDQTSIKVKPGDILVSYAANGPYIVRNGENVKWTFEDGKFVRVEEASTIEIIPAAAVLNKTDYKAADELYGLLVTTGLENGDNLEFLTGVAIKESEQAESSVYEFSEGTTIKVTIENNVTTWMIKSVAESDWVIDNAGAAAGFAKYYTLADENSVVALTGEVAGLVQADHLDVSNGVTIAGEGKVIALDDSLEIYDGENLITPKLDEETGYYTYSLATEPTPTPTTGFAIIIADAEAGTSTTNYYDTLEAAIAAYVYAENAEVAILADCILTEELAIAKKVVIDFCGKTVTAQENADGDAIWVKSGATVTLKNGKLVDNNHNVAIYNSGDLTIASDFEVVANNRSGIMAIAGSGSETKAKLTVYGKVSALGTDGNGTWNAICSHGDDKVGADIVIGEGAHLISSGNGVYFPSAGTLVVNGGVIQGYEYGIYAKSGLVTVTGGEISSLATEVVDPSVNGNGTNGAGHAMVVESGSDAQGYADSLTFSVTGGKFTSVGAAIVNFVQEGADPIAPGISGGTFSAMPDVALIAIPTDKDTAKWVEGEDGYYAPYSFVAVAQIGDVKYETLQEALNVGGNVKLLQNVAVRSDVRAGKTVVLDLNNKKIETEGTALGVSGTLTISGGTVAGLFPIAAFDGADITVANGTYTGVEAAIWCDKGAKVKIEDGEFTATDNAVIRTQGNADKGGNTIVINGGIFNGSITTPGYIACGIYVANADVVQVNGGTWNITGGCGICVRAGVTTVNGGTWNVSGDATGKVGDKTALISCVTFVEDFTDPQYPGYNAETDGIFVPAVIGETVNTVKAKTDFTAFLSGDGYEVAGPDEQGYYTVAQMVDNKQAEVIIAGVATTNNLHDALVAGSVEGAVVTLLKDVNLKGVAWEPIANFNGTFDGAGYTISNLGITKESGDYVGLFANYDPNKAKPVVKNFTILNVDIRAENSSYVAAVFGNGAGLISNVTIRGSIKIAAAKYVGGIDGHPNTSIVDCKVIGDGAATSFIGTSTAAQVGGIYGMGPVTEWVRIFNCSVEGVTIIAGSKAGGIGGRAQKDIVHVGCSVKDAVIKCGAVTIGALVGEQLDSTYSGANWFLNCTASADNVTLTDLGDVAKPFALFGDYSSQTMLDVIVSNDAVGNDLTYSANKWNLTAGTFGEKIVNLDYLTAQCAEGYSPVKGDDGYYTIQRVYNVTIAETENGMVETSVTNNIVAGTEVTITATPATDYVVDTIAVTNGEQEVTVENNKFAMPTGDVTVYVTFKSTAKPGIIPGGDPVPVSGATEADALAEAAKLPITLTADQVSAGLTTADFCNKVRPAAAGGGFVAYVEVAAANAPVIETEKTDVKPIEVGATGFSATIKNAKPGLYYGFKAVDALGTAAEFAPVGAAATATAGGDLKITAPKGTGNARFYKLTVSITNIWAE